MIQVVDLAAKFSAGQLRGLDGEVLDQFDSRDKSHFSFAAEIARNARREDCQLTLIEDVPYNPNYTQAMVKPVLRYQGVIMAYCHPVLERVLWISPSCWMGMFPGVQRAPKGLTKAKADQFRIEAAANHARERGYTPPDLVAEYAASLPEGKKLLKKDTAPLTKSMTDYVSAFLMGEWGLELFNDGGQEAFMTVPGVQPSVI